MVEYLVQEKSEELAALIDCGSRARAKRLQKWLRGPRPEFEEELEAGEEPWLALMDLWPAAQAVKVKGIKVFAHWWDENTPNGKGLVALDALEGLEVLAFYHKPVGAGESDAEQYEGECDEMGFFIVKRDASFELVRQRDWVLPSGYELQSDKSTLVQDFNELTDQDK